MKNQYYQFLTRLIVAACLFLQVQSLYAALPDANEDAALGLSDGDIAGEISGASAADILGLYDGSSTVTSLTSTKGAGVSYNSTASDEFSYDPTGLTVFNSLNNGEDTTDTFKVAYDDGGDVKNATITVTVDGVNDPVTITTGGNTSMADNATGSARQIFGSTRLVVNDPDTNEVFNSVVLEYDDTEGDFASNSKFTASGSGATAKLTLKSSERGSLTEVRTAISGLSFVPINNNYAVGNGVATVDFTLKVKDDSASAEVSKTVQLTINSINDIPVVSLGSGSSNFSVTSGALASIFSQMTIADVDELADTSSDANANLFTAEITVSNSNASIDSSSFSLKSGSQTVYTHSAEMEDLQAAIRAVKFRAPEIAGDYTAILVVTDQNGGDSDPVPANININVSVPKIGISGLAEGVESLDTELPLPFVGATFNSFGSNDRYVEVFLSEAAKGYFDILGPFNDATSADYTVAADKYKFYGNAIDASAALAGLRFNPTQNLAADVGQTYWEINLIVVVKSSEAAATELSRDIVRMRVTPENDVPSISSDSPQYRTTDEVVAVGDEDQLVTPFTTITITDVDEGGTQDLTVTVSIQGQDPVTKQPRDGGGTLESSSVDFTQPDTDELIYTFSGNATEVNAILKGLQFRPSNSRNRVGERETVVFTVRVEDPFAALAEISNVSVVVEAVNGTPVIENIPLRSDQPFDVAGFEDGANTAALPFAFLAVSDGPIASETGPIADTLSFEITLRNGSKGSLSYALPTAAELTTAGLEVADFAVLQAGSTLSTLILSGTPEQLTRSLPQIQYTLSSGYDFPLATPGLSTFDFKLSDSVGNILLEELTIWVREKIVAHIVTSNANSGVGSLRQAVLDANNGDWIVFEFEPDAYPVTITLESGLEVSKNLRLSGPRPDQLTISGDDEGGFSLFTVIAGAELTLEQLTLANGQSPELGGAVSVNVDEGGIAGSRLVARYCHFDNNSAGQFGGALDIFKGSLEVEGCLFTNNEVVGSIAVAGGAIATYTDLPCSIENSTFVNNAQQNDGGLGGGAVCADISDLSLLDGVSLDVLHCTFKDNYDAANQGSAILSNRQGMLVTVGNNIFEDTQGRVLDALGNGAFESLGGNVATDSTEVISVIDNRPQTVALLREDTGDETSVPSGLDGLADNGGPTLTCKLLDDSGDTYDAVDLEAVVTVDQRGALRDADTNIGALQMSTIERLNISEIFAGTSNASTDAFIEFYNPREAVAFDLDNCKVYFDGVLAHTFGDVALLPAGNGYVLYDNASSDAPKWSEAVKLNSESGEIVVRNADGDLVLSVPYANAFKYDAVDIDMTGISITRYPNLEGPFVPHNRVGNAPRQSSSPMADENSIPLDGTNAPPIAVEDEGSYTVFEDESLALTVMDPNAVLAEGEALSVVLNDVEFDGTDTLKVVDVFAVTDASREADGFPVGGRSFAPSQSAPVIIDDVAGGALHGVGIDYDRVSSTLIDALHEGQVVQDVWGYTILDYAEDGTAHARLTSGSTEAKNLKKATSYFVVTITGLNDAPVPDDYTGDDKFSTEENQAIRILGNSNYTDGSFDFKDLSANFEDFDATGASTVYLPSLETQALLVDDIDVDNDDDEMTIELVNVHTTSTYEDLTTTTSAKGATVRLDIRQNRLETHIIYDPRSSEILNKLRADEKMTDTFYYTVKDEHGAIGTALVEVEITGVNDVPTANDDRDYFTSEDTSFVISSSSLLANDTDPDQDGSNDDEPIVLSVTGPTKFGASVTLSGDGSEVVFNPVGIPAYESLARNEVIIDEFTYTIDDERLGQSQATVFIEFVGVNDTPRSTGDETLNINENQTATVAAVDSESLLQNVNEIDINGTTPDDDPWVIPQREITTPKLKAAFYIEDDGSYFYDANSVEIDRIPAGVTVTEEFKHTIIDNSRLNSSADNFKLFANSLEKTLDVLSNDSVAGTVATTISSYTEDEGNAAIVIIESANHELRDGKLIRVEGYEGTADYNGVHAITVVDRDHFSIEVSYDATPATEIGSWRPWFTITDFSEPEQNGQTRISDDGQSLLFTPRVGFYGTDSFTYTIEDGVGGQDVAEVQVLVIDSPINNVAICANDDNFTVYRGQAAVVLDVLVNDNELPALGTELIIIDADQDVATGTVAIINNGKALQYTPSSSSFVGVETFTYIVSGGGTTTATATLTVDVVALDSFVYGDAVADDVFVVETDSTGNVFDVLANDATLPEFPVELELLNTIGTPTAGSATWDNGQILYDAPASTGTVSFTYEVQDELGVITQKTVSVLVKDVADDFYAAADHYVVWAGATTVSLPVLANDRATGTNSTNLAVVNLGLDLDAPDFAERVSFTSNAVRYSPPSTATVETFTYEISDGSVARREAEITIVVLDPDSSSLLSSDDPNSNAYPNLNLVDDTFCVARDVSAVSLDVLANDFVLPLSGWTLTITELDLDDTLGTVEISGGSTIRYTPVPGYHGEDSFTYTVEGAHGQEDTATVTVQVGSLITGADAYVVLENSTDNVFNVLVNDDMLDRYGDGYTVVAVSSVNAVIDVLVTPAENEGDEDTNYYRILYTPTPNFDGTENFTYTVEDETGNQATETVSVTVLDLDSDRVEASLFVIVTGKNDAPVLGGTADSSITDKESTLLFEEVTLSDKDKNRPDPASSFDEAVLSDEGPTTDQIQTVTLSFDPSLGTISTAGLTLQSPGVYQVVGTPAEVVAVLSAVEFTPFENIRPPVYYDAVFTLSITDGDLASPIVDLTTVTILAINDAPVPVDDSAYITPENQAIRILADTTLLPGAVFDFGDLEADFKDTDAMGVEQTYLPKLQTVNLLINDGDVDVDDDNTTIELVNIHTTEPRVDQITATSALGATVTLDIRAVRAETNILYDPRGSAILNALRARETIVDTFYYTVIDQHGEAGQALVSITVTGVNDVPTANDDLGYKLNEDGTIVIPGSEVLSNDTDPDQDSNDPNDMPMIVNFPAESELGATLGFDGTDITYNPDDMERYESLARNEFLDDTITYEISDGEGGTSMAVIELQIEGLNDTPVAVGDTLAIDENDTQTRDAATGLMSNDSDVDMGILFNSGEPNDDPWILPQRTQISPLDAAFTIETNGSYSYDANSRQIDSLFENEIAIETFPYVIIDNSRLSASQDSYKVASGSTEVVLQVLSNDDVAGSIPVAIEGFSSDAGDVDRVIIESFEHPLRENMLVKLEGYEGAGAYNGVYPISVVDRDHFSVEAPYVDGPSTDLGTWRPWFEVTAVTEADQEAVLAISEDGQSILYTPADAFYGSEQFEYTIKDGAGGQDVAIVELTVLQAPLNTVLSASDDRFQIGKGETSVEVDVLVNDNILPALGSAFTITDASVGSAGGSVVISGGSDSLIYTPINTAFIGVETFTYDVSGGGSSSAQATVTFEVIDRESFLDASPDAFFVIEDSANNLLDVAANDASLPSFPIAFDVVAVSTPVSGSASVSGGQVSYTPNPSFVGIDTFTYTIRDASGGNVTQTVEVQVVADVDDFYAQNDHYIIVAGTGEHQLSVLINDGVSGANSTNLTIEDLGLDTQAPPEVSRVSISQVDPTIINYTVPATVPAGSGTEVFNYEIQDNTSEQRREGTITITVVDRLPTQPNALDDAYHVAKNSAAHRLDVLLNDDPLPTAGWVWTISSVSAPSQGGEVTIDADTALIYTPAEGFFGVESFTYTIVDEFDDFSTATVTVTVGAQLTEPDAYVVLEDSTANAFPVLLNDDILERYAADYTIVAVSDPANGTVSIDGSGPNNQLLYAPDPDFIGEDTFTYTVIDNTGNEMTETVTVVVIEENADRDFANFVVTLTGINDITDIANIADGSTTDKLSVKPFPGVTITDLDEDDLQDQITTVTYDDSYGSLLAPDFTPLGNGVYRMTGTPAEVTAALDRIVFTPYENFIDYMDYRADNTLGDVAFNLSIDDLNLGPVLGDSADAPVTAVATINIEPINDDPTSVGGFSDWVLPVNSQTRARLLTPHYADVDDDIATGELVWSATSDNPSLFNSITVDATKQLLVVDFATDQFGVAVVTVRATDRGLLFVEKTFTITIQGPHVLDLDEGELRPDRAVRIGGGFFDRRYRQSFRVTNDGPLAAEAFVVKLSDFGVAGLVLINAEFSSNENASPDNFEDDTRSASGVTFLGAFESDSPPFAIKYDLPLAAGESTVVHFEYRIQIEGDVTIRPEVEIEWARASGDGSMMLIAVVDPETGEYELTFETEVGRSYQLEYSSDLSTWIPWATPIPVSEFDTVVSVIDDGLNTDTHPSLVPTRFYRLVDITPPSP